MSIILEDGHYVVPNLPVRECSFPGCTTEVHGGFSCIQHRHYTEAELRMQAPMEREAL